MYFRVSLNMWRGIRLAQGFPAQSLVFVQPGGLPAHSFLAACGIDELLGVSGICSWDHRSSRLTMLADLVAEGDMACQVGQIVFLLLVTGDGIVLSR